MHTYMGINRLHRMVLERQLNKTGVYRSQHQLLMYISANPNASQKDLAKMHQVSAATVAVSLKKLENGGYIKRVVDQDDNRYNQICITEKGKAIVEGSIAYFQTLEAQMYEGFRTGGAVAAPGIFRPDLSELEPSAARDRKRGTRMKRYTKYVKPYLSAFIIGPCLMITEVLGEIMLPKLMSLIINNGVANRDSGYIVGIGLAMIGIAFLMAVSGIGGAYFSAKASISFTSDLRRDLFAKVQQFSFKNIDDYSTGSLVTRLTNDVQQLQQVMMMGLRLALAGSGDVYRCAHHGVPYECGACGDHPGRHPDPDCGDRADLKDGVSPLYGDADEA